MPLPLGGLMKRFLFLTIILIFIFSVSAFALDVSIYNEVKPFTIDYVDGSGISINGNYYTYQFSNGNDNRYAQIQDAFNFQNNAIALVESNRTYGWQIHVVYSGSLTVSGDWYCFNYNDNTYDYDFDYTLTDGDKNPSVANRFYVYRVNVYVSSDGVVQNCTFGNYALEFQRISLEKENYRPYDDPDYQPYNYVNYGVGWCNNVVRYGLDVIYDPANRPPLNPDPDVPEPDTPEYENLLAAIIDLPRRIVAFIIDGLRSLFFPSEDFISSKFNGLKDEFVFVSSITNAVDLISATFEDLSDEPPVISLDLSAAEGNYNYGSTAVSFDLSWYVRYKPYVDSVLSSILIVFFLWRVFKHLPSIISGIQGVNKDDV